MKFLLITALLATGLTARAELPNDERYQFMQEITRTLDLTASNVTLGMSSGGTSVYGVYMVNGKARGAVLPENAATKVSGEIVTFYLARALGVDHLYSPAIYHHLTGKNLAKLRSVIPSTPYKNSLKEGNRRNLLARIAKSPEGIHTVYKHWGHKPADYDDLVLWRKNSFNTNHVLPGSRTPFAHFLKCDGTRPSQTTQVRMNGGTNTEYELARQLSTEFLIDALSQQWDRFSGGNLQTITVDGVVNFASYDNGGTWGGIRWTQKFLQIVTRFDRNVATELLQLNDFLANGGNYRGFRSEAELARGLGIENFPQAMSSLKQSLRLVADHLRRHTGCYF